MKKKIIVTGGLGFIGSRLIKKLIKNYKITVLDSFYTSSVKKIDGIRLIKCDLTNYNSLKKININNELCRNQVAMNYNETDDKVYKLSTNYLKDLSKQIVIGVILLSGSNKLSVSS